MQLKKEDFNGVYSTIFEHLGEDIARDLYNLFRGQQFNFPMKLYSKEYVLRYLSENYNGNNIRKLARNLDYSERWVQVIISKNKIGVKGDK